MVKEQKRPADKPAYVMPAVCMGQAVLWHDSAGAAATAMAHVTAVGNDTVALAVLGEGFHNMLPKSGVRHYDHPDQDAIRNTDQGCWSYTLWDRQLLSRLAALEDLLAAATK